MTAPPLPKTDKDVRCSTPGCKKLLALMATRPWRFVCPRCKVVVEKLD